MPCHRTVNVCESQSSVKCIMYCTWRHSAWTGQLAPVRTDGKQRKTAQREFVHRSRYNCNRHNLAGRASRVLYSRTWVVGRFFRTCVFQCGALPVDLYLLLVLILTVVLLECSYFEECHTSTYFYDRLSFSREHFMRVLTRRQHFGMCFHWPVQTLSLSPWLLFRRRLRAIAAAMWPPGFRE